MAPVPNTSTTCEGDFNVPANAPFFDFEGGRVGAGETCTISVDVLAQRAGDLSAITSLLFSDRASAAPGIEATLTVNEAPLSVTMAFVPATIAEGGVSTLIHTLTNTLASTVIFRATEVSLSDMLPADLVVADAPEASTTCPGGTVTADTDMISFTGGSLDAGADCTVSVNVTSTVAGEYMNSTEEASVTSSLGTSDPAAATLTVVSAAVAPGFARVFDPDTVARGEETQVVFTVNNRVNTVDITGLAFDDMLPAGVSVAGTPGIVNSCGGTFDPDGGDTTLDFTGGTLAAGATCEIRVTVRAIEAGTRTGPAVVLTSSVATSTATAAMLTIDPAEAPSFTKAFRPITADPGEVSTLIFTIDNAANAIEVGSLAFTDDFPVGLVVADPPNADNGCGGTFEPVAGVTSLTFVDGSVAAGESCTISVDVQALVPGSLENTSGDLTSDLSEDTPGDMATLTVDEEPLVVSMAFAREATDQGAATEIAPGEVSRLTYTLENVSVIGAMAIRLSDTLPANVVVAATPNAETTCTGGTVTTGADTITFADGTLDAGAACTISVNVTSRVPGIYLNPTESVTSSLGTSESAEATLTVTAVGAPVFSVAFSPDMVDAGGISKLTFTIDNGANLIDVRSLAFDNDLPDGLVLAGTSTSTCGGVVSVRTGGTTLALNAGTVPAGESCTVSVDVQALRAGALDNLSGELTSDLPVSTPGAAATLTVNPVPLSVSTAFTPATIGQGGVSRLTYTLENVAVIGATAIRLSDMLPAGIRVAADPEVETGCDGGAPRAPANGNEISWSGGALEAGGACTIAVNVTSLVSGDYPNPTESVTSSLGTSAAAAVDAMLRVDAAMLVFSAAFSPATVDQGRNSRLTFTIDNSANLIDVRSLAFENDFPDGLVVAGTPTSTCGNLVLGPVPGRQSVSMRVGRVAAGETCTFSVDIQARSAGALVNMSGELTSSLPDLVPGAAATLTVNPVPLSVSMAFTPAAIGAGGVSGLTYELRNDAVIRATSVALSDTLPAGVTVAAAPNAETGCVGERGRRRDLPGGRFARGGRNLHGVRRRDLRGGRKLCERHGGGDLVAGHQHIRRGHADGRGFGGAGLCPGVLARYGRSGRGFPADLHHRQYGQRRRGGGVTGLYR